MIKLKFNPSRLIAAIFLTLQIITFTAILSCPTPARAQQTNIKTLEFTPQVAIPNSKLGTKVGTYNEKTGIMTSDLLSRYIMAIYNYGLALAGILATIVLMFGGFNWIISGGDPAKITQAKELIGGSIAGLAILMVAWVILNTINPNLINLKPIETPAVARVGISECSPYTGWSNKIEGETKPCSGETQACLKTTEEIYNPHTNKYTNLWLCLDLAVNKIMCCQYEESFFTGRECINHINDSVTAAKACPEKIVDSLGNDQILKKSWYGNFCNINREDKDDEEKDCYLP